MDAQENRDHLAALELNLSNERMRLANAKTEGERELRKGWVKQLEKEIAFERKYFASDEISDDELLAELGI